MVDMATKLEHTVSYPFSTDRLWEVVTTEQYWRDLLDAMNHDKGVLESFSHDGDTVTVTCRQVVDADKLPSVVQKIRGGDIVIPRRTVLRRTGDSITGELGASVEVHRPRSRGNRPAAATRRRRATPRRSPSASRWSAARSRKRSPSS